MRDERGESLIEIVVAVAIVAIATSALLAGTIAAAHRFGRDPSKTVLYNALHREMRVAIDVMKYQGSAIAPTTIATTIPMPGASPAPAHLSIATHVLAGGSIAITIDASLDAIASETASLTTNVPAPVPLPSSTISATGNAPQ